MLIRNYGLFWRRDNVHWGAGKNAGHLKGRRANEKSAGEVDFREQQGVYVLYDDSFRIVYIGQSGAKNDRLFSRIKRHTWDQLAARWTKFSWFGIREVDYDKNELMKELVEFKTNINGLLNHIEAILITAAEPPHNRQGGRFGADVEQFLQWRDEVNLGPTPERMLKELHKRLVQQQ
jgi:hypothetical protein